MTTPTGAIGLADVNVELGRAGGQYIEMNDGAVRTLAGAGSSGYIISMNDLRGKSSYTPFTAWSDGASYYDAWAATGFNWYYANATMNVSGGRGGFSFAWSWQDNPRGMGLAYANEQTCQTSLRTGWGTAYGTLQCVVTDNFNGTTRTIRDIPVTYEIGNM